MGAHHARERALVRDGQRRVAQRLRAGDQFFRVRRTRQEAEVAAADKLGVTRELVGRTQGPNGANGVSGVRGHGVGSNVNVTPSSRACGGRRADEPAKRRLS